MTIEVTERALDIAPLIAAVSAEGCGGVVAFLGIVRATANDGRRVDGLSYEAYPTMALPEMKAIAAEIEARFEGSHVAMMHRVGELAVGEPSVAIVVAAPHRGAAFDACECAIDELKRRVPIWKKERYVDGGSDWRENVGETT